MRTTIVFAALVAASSSTLAYEPEKHHTLAGYSVDLFNACALTLSFESRITLSDKATIQRYDAGEDNFLSKLPRRTFNWHFYNQNKEPEQKHGLINRSMTGLLASLDHNIVHTRTFDPKLAGSALHFIEDVTVPAHVMPVFHGPVLPLLMGGATGHYKPGNIHDQIDGWKIDSNRIEKELSALGIDPLQCQALFEQQNVSDNPTLTRVQQTATQTLDAVNQPIAECQTPWRWFWDVDYGNTYFTGYRYDWDDNSDATFGETSTLENSCSVKRDDYNDFVFERHLQAIKAGTAFLAYFSQIKGPGS
ncbi:hypothetical protein [Parendozoicomonas haliclonae]|uniref:S1/P1 Nuclease n=1 Tax=Parendozoicomonas haliclonae TaxID=1960125 RepID=A0A1X7APM0_9GAMM|nr:hypothetical protein [Parendozoicomonas haliclonae]SMA50195.1 hypothetical protein EHSB41UT_03988 [Parendozoicomonas haliclonae]